MLEAFFVGRALAEVLNERAGAALGDALAEFGRFDAETRQTIRWVHERRCWVSGWLVSLPGMPAAGCVPSRARDCCRHLQRDPPWRPRCAP